MHRLFRAMARENHTQVALRLHNTLLEFFRGVGASLDILTPFDALWDSKELRSIYTKCLLLNLCLFGGSAALLHYCVFPVLESLAMQEESELPHVVAMLFRVLWLWPVYCISFVFNMVWYNDFFALGRQLVTAKHYSAHRTIYPWSPSDRSVHRSIGSQLASTLVKLALSTMLLVQASLAYLVPVVGPPVAFVLTSLLYAFYAFEFCQQQHVLVIVCQRSGSICCKWYVRG